MDLENYRPISLLSHLYKLFTRILTNRLEARLDFYQSKGQAGFRLGYGTNDHLQSLKTLVEKIIEYNRPLAFLFVNFHKAFDTVETVAILKAPAESRIDYRYSNIIQNIYENETTTVNFHCMTEKIKIGRGMRQGDTLSSKLFTTVMEYAFKQLEWDSRGINIDGQRIIHLRYADDLVLMADNLGEARDMLQQLQKAAQRVGLKINYRKTKMMTNLVPSEPIKIEKSLIEIVDTHVYLAHEITKDLS